MKKSKINKKTTENKEHSEFGGSQAERIMNCPGSVRLSRGIPNKDNAASLRGTAAHACLEYIINNRKKLYNKKTRQEVIDHALEKETEIINAEGKVVDVIQWDETMVEDALDALTWIKKQIAPKGVLYVEEKLDTSAFTTDDQSSTLDVGIANYSARELIICDYKYGKYKVEVKKNAQLIYYALGMLIKLKGWKKFDRVRLVIIQPNSTGSTISEHYMTVNACIKWGKKFRKVVKVALKKNAPLKVGDKYCFFCKAKSICPEMQKKMLEKEFEVVA